MQTVGDVIEFWNAYCDAQDVERNYGEHIREKGAELIADDCEYWADKGMARVLDAVSGYH